MTLFRRVARKVAIEPELSPVLIGRDGSIKTATPEDELRDDAQLITAERDMLPVAHDSPLRTWGFWSMAGYWIAECVANRLGIRPQRKADACTAGASVSRNIKWRPRPLPPVSRQELPLELSF